ncbi:glycosyltransferase family 2 protein [Maribellus sp. YY47]|uniref:glycosyltransferase family 2 protein n=1 Tax=Maribellus sp. YY47 TaxID=2929486 RepID=UPI002000B810|nr:glycosyltransferase family 2 protein [Maribellus sp. YY47]MCK3683749.1 glycosyltransferase [Maribellus sp. YY47]
MNKIKVSIVIPVYNTEQYLEKCLDSVIGQTLKEIEIIVVNDQSPDDSQSIINKFIRKDCRITAITNETNMGLGASRNKAIKYCKGEYILFLDSDDWIHSKTCEYFFQIAEEYNTDIIEGLLNPVTSRKLIDFDTNFDDLTKNLDISIGSTYLNLQRFIPSVCNKFWKKNFIQKNDLRNKEDRFFEDIYMSLPASLKAKKICKINFPFYFQYINPLSITRQKKTLKHIEDRNYLLQFLSNELTKATSPESKNVIRRIIAERIEAAVSDLLLANEGKDSFKELTAVALNLWPQVKHDFISLDIPFVRKWGIYFILNLNLIGLAKQMLLFYLFFKRQIKKIGV